MHTEMTHSCSQPVGSFCSKFIGKYTTKEKGGEVHHQEPHGPSHRVSGYKGHFFLPFHTSLLGKICWRHCKGKWQGEMRLQGWLHDWQRIMLKRWKRMSMSTSYKVGDDWRARWYVHTPQFIQLVVSWIFAALTLRSGMAEHAVCCKGGAVHGGPWGVWGVRQEEETVCSGEAPR